MISVIMPTNRVDDHFDTAVRSILASVNVELELVIVLDAIDADLTNFSWSSDPRVTWVTTPAPSGSGGTMQFGMAASSGKYVARMDADDVSLPKRLEMQARFLDENPETVAVSSLTTRIDENGRVTGLIDLPSGQDIRRELLLQNVVPHPTLMFRRSAYEAVGGYRSDLKQMEDYVFVLSLSLHGPIAQLDDRLVQYRVHSGQMSRGAKAHGDYINAVLDARRRLAKHLTVSPLVSGAQNVIWLSVQHLRAMGLLKPGHRR